MADIGLTNLSFTSGNALGLPAVNALEFGHIETEMGSDMLDSFLSDPKTSFAHTDQHYGTDGTAQIEIEEEVGMMLDTATSRKCRRYETPLDISEVRRSSRSTRFQGFKAPSMADKKKKQSLVKPRKTPGVTTTDVL